MIFNKESFFYFLFASIGLISYWLGMIELSIAFKTLGLLFLAIIYWLKFKKLSNYRFFIGLVLIAVAEAFFVNGFQYEEFQIPSLVLVIIYYWLTFFLIKTSINSNKIRLRKLDWINLILVLLLIAYLAYMLVGQMFELKKDILYVILIDVFSVASLCAYCVILYSSDRSSKKIWLVLLCISFIVSQCSISIDALYYPSIYIKTIGLMAHILEHYFVYQFLVTPEKDIASEENKYVW